MGFLAPALLALGLAVTVPLVLHLLQRHPGPRVTFPALRYLRRAERQHASRIRLRQILLLALRIVALLLLAAAAARPFLRRAGDEHPPTAVVIVLDNSASTGAVVDDRRVLDELKEAALETLARVGVDDRVWLLRAGSPWEPAVTGTAGTVMEAVRRTEPSAGAANLSSELQRARSILTLEADARRPEIQFLSDLQATTFGSPVPPPDRDISAARAMDGGDDAAPAVLIYSPSSPPPANRGVAAVEVGGGLPPRAGQRSTVSVRLTDAGQSADTGGSGDSVAVRLVVDGSVRAAGWARPGAAVVLPFPARPAGPTAGHVEIDPDALLADDRRYFVTDVARPVAVGVAGSQPFLAEAVSVLEDAGRVERVPVSSARVVLAPAGRSADAVRRGASVVVMPPSSPTRLAATNQRLAAAGIPWRYTPPESGQSRLEQTGPAVSASVTAWLPEIRLRQVYGLMGERADSVTLRLRDGTPWMVVGRTDDDGRFLLLGSPLTVGGGTIATSAAMVPFLDELITRWAAEPGADGERAPGTLITVDGDSVASPEGVEPVRDGGVFRLRVAGIHRVLAGTDTVAAYAVNPPVEESHLARAAPERLADRLNGWDVAVATRAEWSGAIFRHRSGRDVTPWLVVAALMLLGLEMAASATGKVRTRDEGQADPARASSPTVGSR